MRRQMTALLMSVFLIGLLTGCSRETMNAQIAESIGTLGKYENNEPVETPKMKAQREMEEAKNEHESAVKGHLEKAERLAASFDYAKALEEIEKIDEKYQEDDRVITAKIDYQRLQNMMVLYNEEIPHLSVKNLIVDPALAFDNDDMSYYYNNGFLTTEEFKKILQSLYDNNYILMDVKDLVVTVENEDGTTSFAKNMPTVPEGKKPIVLSFAEANYYSNQDGNGFSSAMVVDEEGKVQNVYRDSSGKELTGAYDVVPIVDAFVEEHPDFSMQGAKGIISVTGYEGVFGYGIETGGSTITEIAESLKANGWQIACQGFGNNTMETGMDYDTMVADLEEWDDKVGSLVGETELLIFPYGEEVSQGTLKFQYLLDHGYKYFFGMWATAEYLKVETDFVSQTRRTLDGYNLYFYKEDMKQFFDAGSILDESRPAFE